MKNTSSQTCFNYKILIPLAIIALGALLFFPDKIVLIFPILIVLICPLSMLFMGKCMYDMSKKEHDTKDSSTPHK